MRELNSVSSFRKHFKKVSKYPKFSRSVYDEVVSKLMNGETLAPKYRDHKASPSSPKWLQGLRILHLSPHICLVYSLTPDMVMLVDIGSHQDLGLTESKEKERGKFCGNSKEH